MIRKKKKNLFSSKGAGRRADSSTIGTHVPRHGVPDAQSPQAQRQIHESNEVKFAPQPEGGTRKDSTHGLHAPAGNVIAQMAIPTSKGKGGRGRRKRAAGQSLAEKQQRRQSRLGIVGLIAVAAVALIVAVSVGFFVFFNFSNAKIKLEPSNASEALVKAEANKPYYVLCSAELGTATAVGGAETDAYLLLRVDEQQRQLTLVAIPSNLDVWLVDGANHPLYDARQVGGDAELVRAVGELAGVSISHFVDTDATRMSRMVDAMGGVPMEIAAEVDDPRAGTIVMMAGDATVNGQQALVLLRGMNYSEPFEGAARNRMDFFMAFATRALTAGGIDFVSLVGDIGDYVNTDYTSNDLIDLADRMRPIDTMTVYEGIVPGHTSWSSGKYVYNDELWAAMCEAFRAGEDPSLVTAHEENASSNGISVEVRNGSGATGMASRMAEVLIDDGFTVTKTGNSDDGTLYAETLVIHKTEATASEAQTVQAAIGAGRVVEGGDFYNFDGDVLVIIGIDWML